MIEQFNFDIQLIFAILNGKVSAAINRKLSRNFRQNGLEITPEQWTVLIFLWEKDGVTQQELCNATFKDKPSMTRLIDNMERQHLVVRIPIKKTAAKLYWRLPPRLKIWSRIIKRYPIKCPKFFTKAFQMKKSALARQCLPEF